MSPRSGAFVAVRRRQLRVVAGLIERGSCVLICQRRPSDRHPLKWEFPGGKVEPGEDPVAALQRELREELALEASIGPEIIRYEYRYPKSALLLLIFYRVSEFKGEPTNLRFEEIRWEPPQRLTQFDFLDGDKDFIRLLSRGEL